MWEGSLQLSSDPVVGEYKIAVQTGVRIGGSVITFYKVGKEMFDLTTHSTHSVYGHMAPDV